MDYVVPVVPPTGEVPPYTPPQPEAGYVPPVPPYADGGSVPPVPPQPPLPVPPPVYGGAPTGPVIAATDWKNSYFDGGTGAYIGISLLTGLLSTLSLGFAAPALVCWMLRWKYGHTVVGGYRLKFNGRGGQLFGKWLLWGLLTVVTLGIFGLWVPVKLMKWETKHLEIDSAVLTPPAN